MPNGYPIPVSSKPRMTPEEVLAMEEAWCCKIAERHMPEIERAVHMAIETDEPITIDDLLLP